MIGGGYLFAAGAFLGFLVLGLRRGKGGGGLCFLGFDVGNVEAAQGISLANRLPFLDQEAFYPARYFAGYANLIGVGLSLDVRVFGLQEQYAYQGDYHDGSDGDDKARYHALVVRFFFVFFHVRLVGLSLVLSVFRTGRFYKGLGVVFMSFCKKSFKG